ncbi:MFS transporter [Streptomyces sp. NPDC052000]|uniref:MFS transporter n=1 Tax=Streptomyces sp. NPDC052000 TaxID=3155676 RepID=UPI0034503DF2
MAPVPSLFGAGRFVVGFGVGAIYPAMTPLIFELAPEERKNLYSGIVQCGTAIGGSFAALTANTMLRGHGFQLEYLVGGLAGLLLLPLTYAWLPESTEHHRAVSASPLAAGSGGVRLVLKPPYLRSTLVFSVMAALAFLLIFGMNTWLPQLMQVAGRPLRSSQTFLMLLNLGATVGVLAMALLADRVGSKGPVTAAFVLGGAAITAMGTKLPLAVLDGILFLGGCGAVGVQGLINVYVSRSYPQLPGDREGQRGGRRARRRPHRRDCRAHARRLDPRGRPGSSVELCPVRRARRPRCRPRRASPPPCTARPRRLMIGVNARKRACPRRQSPVLIRWECLLVQSAHSEGAVFREAALDATVSPDR